MDSPEMSSNDKSNEHINACMHACIKCYTSLIFKRCFLIGSMLVLEFMSYLHQILPSMMRTLCRKRPINDEEKS